jgi:hypothetical protein
MSTLTLTVFSDAVCMTPAATVVGIPQGKACFDFAGLPFELTFGTNTST